MSWPVLGAATSDRVPLEFAPTKRGAPTCTLCAPLVSVKQISQKMPAAPSRLPVVTLLPGQFFVSGYFCRKNLSRSALFC